MTAIRDLHVGLELPPLRLDSISRLTLALFAGASGDHNPIHLEPATARAAGMPDVFAHGMLSMAYLGRLLTNWVPQRQILDLRVRFTAVTPVEAQPTCRGHVVAVHELDGGCQADLELSVVLADGTTTVRGSATVAMQ